MNIIINSHHLTITDAMKEADINKLSKVERHFDQIQSINVILSLDNHHSDSTHQGHNCYKAEAILRVSGKEMFVSSHDDDMYQAINQMADKLDRQIRKYKTRINHKHRNQKHHLWQSTDETVIDKAVVAV